MKLKYLTIITKADDAHRNTEGTLGTRTNKLEDSRAVWDGEASKEEALPTL